MHVAEKRYKNDASDNFTLYAWQRGIFVPQIFVCGEKKKYDTIFLEGDCRKFKASFTGFGEERACICQKRVNVNGKWKKLDGTFYRNMGASPNCLYDYRETCNNAVYLSQLHLEVIFKNIFIISLRLKRITINSLWQNMLNIVQ